MKCINKKCVRYDWFTLLFILVAFCPSMALAAKADKVNKADKVDSSDKLGKAQFSFDISKMSDMSDFDPAHPVVPTGDVSRCPCGPFFRPGAINGETHYDLPSLGSCMTSTSGSI